MSIESFVEGLHFERAYAVFLQFGKNRNLKQRKKTFVKDLVYFMATLDLPKEGARISKSKNIP